MGTEGKRSKSDIYFVCFATEWFYELSQIDKNNHKKLIPSATPALRITLGKWHIFNKVI